MKKIVGFIFILLMSFIVSIPVVTLKKGFSQEAIQYDKSERALEEEQRMRERLKQKLEKPKIERKEEKKGVPEEKAAKVLIKKIEVTGVTVFSKKKITEIVKPYQGKVLTLKKIHKVADLITDLYRRNGYLTSRAYIPPQDLTDGILEIRVLEGKMGNLKIKNPDKKYFSDELIKSKVRLEKGEYFDYEKLRKSLIKINQHPDRTARAVLVPGTEPGQTDVILKVEDQRPYHVGFEYDNFGSGYIGKDRFGLTFDHNNLTGNDDILNLKLQFAEADQYALKSLRYLFPIGYTWELGLYALRSRSNLGEEYEDLEVAGKSTIISGFVNKYFIDEENLDVKGSLGFDYKHVRNFQLGSESSRDELRVVKASVDVDNTDKWGRTIFVNEFSYGIPDLWGAMEDVDSAASRIGSGGEFTKGNIHLLRLNDGPLTSTILWKNQFQISPYILPATEEFQVGGIRNNRGYPPAELVGDEGATSVIELSMPIIFIPKKWKVPKCDKSFYDALRAVAFYDWGWTKLHRPQVPEEKEETLRSLGCGLRFNMPEDNLSIRLEFGWPQDRTPSDGDHMHSWVRVSKSF